MTVEPLLRTGRLEVLDQLGEGGGILPKEAPKQRCTAVFGGFFAHRSLDSLGGDAAWTEFSHLPKAAKEGVSIRDGKTPGKGFRTSAEMDGERGADIR